MANDPVVLLPCPFCGNDQIHINRIEPHTHHLQLGDFKMPDYPGSWSVECGVCESGKMSMESEADAIARWNTRAAIAPHRTEAEAHQAFSDWFFASKDLTPTRRQCWLAALRYAGVLK